MMLDVSGLMGSSGDGAEAADAHDGGGASGGSSEVGVSRSIPGGGGRNRWPRQETLSLLKIRSEMDVAFRDSSLKGPLWEEVSRKMAELGFHRSAKKCKEKFENVYKYHKRTKDGRSLKPDGKTYGFSDQLQAMEITPSLTFTPPQPAPAATLAAPQMPTNATNFPTQSHVSTVPLISPNPISILPPNTNSQSTINPINKTPLNTSNLPQIHTFHTSNPSLVSNSSSSSTSSDEDIQRQRGKKRKWKDFFEKLTREVVNKQEEMQKKFMDTLEKWERDRMSREEAWRAQEIARMNREHDILAQERSIAAAKDAAVIAFLQKVTEQPNLPIQIGASTPRQVTKSQPPPPQAQSTLPLQAVPVTLPAVPVTPAKILNTEKTENEGDSFVPTSSSRWPKAEIDALIKLRTDLDIKYQDNGPKGPLWEEISVGMRKMGYSRSSKRCKEKWENINKYYKKVKESSKKRPEDSKTCPYFRQLEALYKEKTKNDIHSLNPAYTMNMAPIMARPEQQWPLPERPQEHDEDHDSEINEEEEDEEEEEGVYEIITNKESSITDTAEQ